MFYDQVECDVEGVLKFECKHCGITRQQKKGNGYTNTTGHVKSQHFSSYLGIMKAWKNGDSGPIDACVQTATDTAKKIYGWMEWVIDDDLPFEFLNSKHTRLKTNVMSMCPKSLKLYIKKTTKKVRLDKVKLPPSFGLVNSYSL